MLHVCTRTYPGRHAVGCGAAEVDVEDPDGDQDGEGHQDHGEEQVLACNHIGKLVVYLIHQIR